MKATKTSLFLKHTKKNGTNADMSVTRADRWPDAQAPIGDKDVSSGP